MMKRMHLWAMDHERKIDESIYRYPKLQSTRPDYANECCTALKSEDPNFIKEDPNPISCDLSTSASQFILGQKADPDSSEENPSTSALSFEPPKFIFEETEVLASQVKATIKRQEEDPLAISPVEGRPDTADHTADQLLATAAERLRMRLKPNWICLMEGEGIHTMQLSRNFEKCVQRRIYFTRYGDVHLSVHCVPIPISEFVPCLRMVKLSQHNIFAFVEAMESTVNVVRQLEICTGVPHDKYRHLWEGSKRGEVDKNPYQEARYSVTLRSNQCCRLVRPRQRMCYSCGRLFDSLRRKAAQLDKLSDKSHSLPSDVSRKTVKNIVTPAGKACNMC